MMRINFLEVLYCLILKLSYYVFVRREGDIKNLPFAIEFLLFSTH